MKSILKQKIVVGLALAFLSLYICSASDMNSPNLKSLNVVSEKERSLNIRLSTIANEPSILKKLDQRSNFCSDQAYLNTLNASLAAAKGRLSDVFSTTNLEHMVTAVCLADSKVFFWLPKDDCVLIGWIPIVRKEKPESAKSDIVLWLVPQTIHKTKLSEVWQNRKNADQATWLQDVLKVGLNLVPKDVVSARTNGLVLRGSIKPYDLEAIATENIIEVKMSPQVTKDINFPGKPVMAEKYLNNMPTVLPFWPPKETNEITQAGIGQQAFTNELTVTNR